MKVDRKVLLETPEPMPPSEQPKQISRRVFLGATAAAAAGGALVIGFSLHKRGHAGAVDEAAGKVAEEIRLTRGFMCSRMGARSW